ncbi:alpha/beta hydrolase [uncultured Paraglaciecola sp.]|uniref:alpha/beta hydrolase family protein n=1 Tax=uncultured Paraglaciecola sp. TaxID=1765024 RepID=UPI0025E71444|nr:alpha/beta hydrolase [uncultured Paraglaciecola sp.]
MHYHLILSSLLLVICFSTQAKLELTQIKAYPKYSAEVTVLSHGKRLPAIFYGAQGKGPHPTIILLHGYPGNEKNLDVAQHMRDTGWNVVFFHYRGAWGAEGNFSFSGSEQDVTAVTTFLQQPENAQKFKINTDQISYIGHSMGGHMAVAGIVENPEVRCAVVYDGANIGVTFKNADEKVRNLWAAYADSLFMLQGWSSEVATEELSNKGKQLDLLPRAHKIADRPILFIPADSDVIPISEIDALVTEMRKVKGNRVHYTLIKDDHSFNNSRLQLIDVTKRFLNTNCR